MYLHENKDLFKQLIDVANTQSGASKAVIEKDYYVTAVLKLLFKTNPKIVFKGGTALSKCFHLIDRFSEDIDITFGEHIGAAQRKKLKYNVIKSISDELGMPIENWDDTESDRDYNSYLFRYQPVSNDPSAGIASGVRLETALVSYAFPTEEKEVSSLIYEAIRDDAPDIIDQYELRPFSMKVQSVSRTLIDKIFALCDYYMQGKTKRYSRHMYDIYKVYPIITTDEDFQMLVEQVREQRAQLSICPSAKEGVNINALIKEFLGNDFYKNDYDTITRPLIRDNVSYEQTVDVLREIADELF